MLVYDAEIRNAICLSGEREPGISYCEGFDDFDHMGIAVICAFDYEEMCPRVFLGDNLAEFGELVMHHRDAGSKICGFNSLFFDNRLCSVHGIDIPMDDSFDLLVAIWVAAGLSPIFCSEQHKGYGLADCALANGIDIDKRHDSARAPIDFQQGRIGRVIDHCMTDVMILKMLMDRVRDVGGLIDPKSGEVLVIENPFVASGGPTGGQTF